ncbi:MAG: thiamine phosphate synthase [Candidatus Latescibacteria bacterium]|nr:thiamine phosphate synthase [Candidatus Latescibacterota bacterium]NIM21799.1 thiamine phosphate synthase [Candidatus Latescibacterota bacterium]NIM65937.1 thiamine phosphate synthase [Candidatus Latescibacterota bacterium]NIO02682.1 thiamine phosphate synthase [Candidatus Latescibacterota bacterium]NIO29663.1 thiamine phosphate synthase [Candidatus Latescibacterota bacterium]
MIDFKLYLITNRTLCRPATLEKAVEEACSSGVRVVQLREKDLPGRQLYEEALALRKATHRAGSKLLVNDRIDIALAVGADGIHCPENGIPIGTARHLQPDALIGVSVHSLERAVDAQIRGADFILFGPIFSTASKAKYGDPQGLEALSTVSRNAGIPIFAIGGITPENACFCIEHGAAGVGVVSAIMSAQNIPKAVKAFENALEGL